MSMWVEAHAADPTPRTAISSSAAAKLDDLGLIVIPQEDLDALQRAAAEREALLDALGAVGIELIHQRIEDRDIWMWRLGEPRSALHRLTTAAGETALRIIAACAIRDYAQRTGAHQD